MSLAPKTAKIQFRVDPEMLERFQEICDLRGQTLSSAVRMFMRYQIDQHDREVERKRATKARKT